MSPVKHNPRKVLNEILGVSSILCEVSGDDAAAHLSASLGSVSSVDWGSAPSSLHWIEGSSDSSCLTCPFSPSEVLAFLKSWPKSAPGSDFYTYTDHLQRDCMAAYWLQSSTIVSLSNPSPSLG